MKAPLSSSTSSSSSGILRRSRLSTYLYTLLAFIVFVAIIHGEYSIASFGRVDPIIPSPVTSTTPGELTLNLTQTQNSSSLWCFGWFILCVCGVSEEKGEGGGAAAVICGGGKWRRMCYIQWEVGQGRVDSASLWWIGVSIHPATINV